MVVDNAPPEPRMNPKPHEIAGIAIDTSGSSVQSSTHKSDAKLDTSNKRSFHDPLLLLSLFLLIVETSNESVGEGMVD